MHTGCLPDPPGTINPAKLMLQGATQPPSLSAPPQWPQVGLGVELVSYRNGHVDVKVEVGLRNHDRQFRKRSRLPRISSERQVCGSFGSMSHWMHLEGVRLWRQFDQFCGRNDALSKLQLRNMGAHGSSQSVMHSRYFQWQTRAGRGLCLVPDPSAGPDACVVVESSNCSIWDAYMLRVDVSKNINWFKRQQITFDKTTKHYTFWVREGCVGRPGDLSTVNRTIMSGLDLRPLTAKFRSFFNITTGQRWELRYIDPPNRPSVDRYSFVELDYSLDNGARTASVPSLPDYSHIYSSIHGEVKDMMDLILHGGTNASNVDMVKVAATQWVPYTAPYNHLSHFTLYKAFTVLKFIIRILTDGRPIKWKGMQELTSLYRSRVPYFPKRSNGHFGPVVANYQSVLLELQLLSSLWPGQRQIQDEITDVGIRAAMQLEQHGMLAMPLYHAYSSLQHGFRKLTDFDSVEYRELRQYLLGSNHPLHRMRFEIQDIYRVFVKKGIKNGYRDWIEGKRRPIMDACSGTSPDNHHTSISVDRNSQGALSVEPYPRANRKPVVIDKKLHHIPIAKNEERLLLWHGTPLDSLQGILEMGLQIRRRGADFTGTMFGNGIYLADSSSKSAGFCRHMKNAYHTNATHPSTNRGVPYPGSGTAKNRRKYRARKEANDEGREAVLLLCEADVGQDRIRSEVQIPHGHAVIAAGQGFGPHCIQGVGHHGPVGWKNVDWDIEAGPVAKAGELRMPDTAAPYGQIVRGAYLRFNEYVLYNPSHLIIRYLFRIKIRGPGCY